MLHGIARIHITITVDVAQQTGIDGCGRIRIDTADIVLVITGQFVTVGFEQVTDYVRGPDFSGVETSRASPLLRGILVA